MRQALSALILAASAAISVPAFAQAGPGEIRQDQRDVRRESREYRQDLRQGDYREANRDRREVQGAQRELRQDMRRDDWNDNGRRPGWNGGRPGGPDGRPGWNNGRPGQGAWNDRWRDDRRFDWQRYRDTNRRFYTLPRYYGPSGYAYRRYGVGVRIGAPFFAQRYWIADPWAYRLPPVYGPYRWVRYYNDVLLVDIYTGQIRDAIYGFFY
ncbi:RcnB family protein [Sphingomonas quercus]|uniref:RcnB family protein n=1 Tax=Sphingomonas quercus TaxID=2842451 RepID=A0ABS6BIJ4_9SPHN|nr:RcnB family protein [Sphingomonas quercus]MBU3078135.1 RcnB family protein [Sphingomonas quercus]